MGVAWLLGLVMKLAPEVGDCGSRRQRGGGGGDDSCRGGERRGDRC